jgi:hypothetical protein
MKPRIIAEIRRITGDRLTAAECNELAESVMKITEDYSKSIAASALDAAKRKIVETSRDKTG